MGGSRGRPTPPAGVSNGRRFVERNVQRSRLDLTQVEVPLPSIAEQQALSDALRARLLDIIEAKGREVAEAVAALRALSKLEG